MIAKQELLKQVTTTLVQHLPSECYSVATPNPENGNLGLDIPYVRVEPWLYGTEYISEYGAWNLTMDKALPLNRVPVLAYPCDEKLVFRVPMYVLNYEYELSLPEDKWHEFDWSLPVTPAQLGLVLSKYQELRDEQSMDVAADHEYREMLADVLGGGQ